MATPQPDISLFDKSFDVSNANQYKLYIELSTTGLKQTILDLNSKSFIALEHYKFDTIYNESVLTPFVSSILKENKLYQLKFKSISLAYVNNRSTLIPNAIFDKNKLAEYHRFNFSVNTDDYYMADKLINLSANNIYSLPTSITTLFSEFENIKFSHFSSAFIEQSLLTTKSNKALSAIYVNVLENSFQVCIIKNQQLALYNSFIYQSSEDFIYYLLFVLDQEGINNEEATITLSGIIDKQSPIYTIMYKYINQIEFAKRTESIAFSYILEEIPHHSYYTLFNQYLCE